MLRTTIRASVDTDVPEIIVSLRRKAEHSGVPAAELAMLTSGVEKTLNDLLARSRDMVGTTTILNAERTFKDAAYEVRLVFGAGGKPSLLRRLSELLGVR